MATKVRYRGREFKAIVGAQTMEDLQDIIFELEEAAQDAGMDAYFEVVDIREDPDGGYEALVIAHNFNPFKWVKERAKQVGGWVSRKWKEHRRKKKEEEEAREIGRQKWLATGGEARLKARERELELRRKLKKTKPGKAKKEKEPGAREIFERAVGAPGIGPEHYIPRVPRRETEEMIPAGRAIWQPGMLEPLRRATWPIKESE